MGKAYETAHMNVPGGNPPPSNGGWAPGHKIGKAYETEHMNVPGGKPPSSKSGGGGGWTPGHKIGDAIGVDFNDASAMHVHSITEQIKGIRDFGLSKSDINELPGVDIKQYAAVTKEYETLVAKSSSPGAVGGGGAAVTFADATKGQPLPPLGKAELQTNKWLCMRQSVLLNFPANKKSQRPVGLATADNPLLIPISGSQLLASVEGRIKGSGGDPAAVHVLPMRVCITSFKSQGHGFWSASVWGTFVKTFDQITNSAGKLMTLDAKGVTPSQNDKAIMLTLIKMRGDKAKIPEEAPEVREGAWKVAIIAELVQLKTPFATEAERDVEVSKRLMGFRTRYDAGVREAYASEAKGHIDTHVKSPTYRAMLMTPDAATVYHRTLAAKPVSSDSKLKLSGGSEATVKGVTDGSQSAVQRMHAPLNSNPNSPELWTVLYKPLSNHECGALLFCEKIFADHAQTLKGGLGEFTERHLGDYLLYYGNNFTEQFESILIHHFRHSISANPTHEWKDFHMPLPVTPETNNAFTYFFMRVFIFRLLELMNPGFTQQELYAEVLKSIVWNMPDPCIRVKDGLEWALKLHARIQNIAGRDRKVLPLEYPGRQASLFVALVSTSSTAPLGREANCGCDVTVAFEFELEAAVVSHPVDAALDWTAAASAAARAPAGK